jgi:hypothetical protein
MLNQQATVALWIVPMANGDVFRILSAEETVHLAITRE